MTGQVGGEGSAEGAELLQQRLGRLLEELRLPLIPDLDHFSDAWVIAERFREAVERFDWVTEDHRLAEKPPKVDVGVVCLLLGSVQERRHIARQLAHELLARADKLMYEAKGERASHIYPLRVRIQDGALVELRDDEIVD